MRIVAGEFGGRRLTAPKGRATRPTTDKVREALFSLLGPMTGLVAADLFAGSGALGLEALSRGAERLVAVDAAGPALAAIKANIEELGLGEEITLLRRDLKRGFGFLEKHGPFDLILADPPYDKGWPKRLLRGLRPEILNPGGRLVIETSTREPVSESSGWRPAGDRTYGRTRILILSPEAL